jgi:uncharacterized Zn-binding protein involved in type VI secretion
MRTIKAVMGGSLVCALACLGVAACSSDKDAAPIDDHGHDPDHGHEGEVDFCDLPASCQEIMKACHPKDLGEGDAISDCHAVAHEDGTQASCDARHDECVELCNDTPLPPNASPYEPENCGDAGDADHDG